MGLRFSTGSVNALAQRARRAGARLRGDGPVATLRWLREDVVVRRGRSGSRSTGEPFELRAGRVTVRTLKPDDIPTIVRYRNIAGMERFQDWSVPYTTEMAMELLEHAVRHGGPTEGEWVQLGIELDGELIGDSAVWLDDAGQVGEIGATIAPEFQAHGYATDFLDGMLHWLFDERGVHRMRMSIEPGNIGSALVLERYGFEYVGTIRSGHYVRGEWVDNAGFSLLADDWRTWSARSTDPPNVELVELTSEMVRRVGAIAPPFLQRDSRAPLAVTLADALVPPTEARGPVVVWVRVIVADGEPVGFMVVAEPHDASPEPSLWRLVVDYRHLGRDIERQAVRELARRLHAAGHNHLDVCYDVTGPSRPAKFYRSLGFVPTGEGEGGEEIARLDLSTLSDGNQP